MRFGWVRTSQAKAVAVAIGLVGLVGLAACGAGAEDNAAELKKAEEAAAFFMKKNADEEGVVTLPSGLQYKIVASGPAGSPRPDGNDLVRVDYEGALVDGTVFDSSYTRGAPMVTTPEQVIPGWNEGLQQMRVGDEWLFYVPPKLGYGERGAPPTIPANAVLVFRVKMLDVAPAPGGSMGVGMARG
ncbi:FKBP-type peptidyl-prolyl cis-trans isomerase [Brevundimonas sp.]|uniref:FKBP-type peptidyl-prolyl cis-trans isomerase n=1 Tax=Brevundimonas sp. TaxID=1871086 RepID=UPI002ABAE7E5|nr:FKBP-type peptidyl-prolyl cis-trans isomerase [Brevundimonas sp.]MDZ4365226.1 FKBP-type peptidyl-prolyl cis-trans isomerase [Brevundimonas sp.]